MLVRLMAYSLLAFAWMGCGAIDKTYDCNHICQRYHDCFDTSYDVGSCASRCEQHSDDTYRHDANTCSACIDGESCTDAVFSCGGDCSTVVP